MNNKEIEITITSGVFSFVARKVYNAFLMEALNACPKEA